MKNPICQFCIIENAENEKPLEATLYCSPRGENDWDIARLSLDRAPRASSVGTRSSMRHVELPPHCEKIQLQRLSLVFQSPAWRLRFGGHPCQCETDPNVSRTITAGNLADCLEANHQGIFGLIREYRRQQMTEWIAAQASVDGLRLDTLPEDSFG
jgi:hypothetical protein